MDLDTNREILLNCEGQWLALEGEYWPALLRLIKAHGLDPTAYAAPRPSGRTDVNVVAARELLSCLNNAVLDIPHEDLWSHYEGDPDPHIAPPHEFFSGCGVSYLVSIIDFVGLRSFAIEVSEPGTKYCFLGPLEYRPGMRSE